VGGEAVPGGLPGQEQAKVAGRHEEAGYPRKTRARPVCSGAFDASPKNWDPIFGLRFLDTTAKTTAGRGFWELLSFRRECAFYEGKTLSGCSLNLVEIA
jgi:hypothetical protein